ncbi:unnamed protein product [Paramecium primaurelia]|uniref:Uncharacterized protein n=1 Tax=Paramecium primaurelia TaxID=5886 RepID=A0A8S1LSF2_PARPR|nr:unnamed protein product [Paramecium primaurelia]
MIIIRLSRHFSKIKKDLLTNPEFDKIHPQFLDHKPPTTLHRQSKEVPYIKSLLRYKDIAIPTFENALHQNFKTFVEGHVSPKGALKNLSEEQMKQIQTQVTKKLQELEDTGLSREEILTNGVDKGIPLSYDAFFQLLKNNEQARLVYMAPGEEFTVQKIVDIALRQDIGKDQFNVPINKYPNNMKLKNHNKQKDILINTKDHLEHVNELVSDEVVYHHHPQPKRPIRRVNNYDIHWRNTEFLIQFLNKSAKIKNRQQTNLAEVQHKKVARSIKTANHMLLLPSNSSIQPYHKKSLTSFEDDIQEFARRKVNLSTGQIYTETPLQKRERSLESQTMIDDDQEINPGSNRPNNMNIIKGIVYAEKLKKKELEQQGIKLTKEEEDSRNYRFNGNDVKFQIMRDEQILKQEIKKEIEAKDGEFVEEFNQIKSNVEKIPTYYLSQAFISEQTLQMEKLQELVYQKPKQAYTYDESLRIIEEVKSRLNK